MAVFKMFYGTAFGIIKFSTLILSIGTSAIATQLLDVLKGD
jgi:hypothetical protein